jgi:hypothetical protein
MPEFGSGSKTLAFPVELGRTVISKFWCTMLHVLLLKIYLILQNSSTKTCRYGTVYTVHVYWSRPGRICASLIWDNRFIHRLRPCPHHKHTLCPISSYQHRILICWKWLLYRYSISTLCSYCMGFTLTDCRPITKFSVFFKLIFWF